MRKSVSCTFEPVPRAELEELINLGMFALSEQALTDSNFYVKVDTGTMRDNSHAICRPSVLGLDLEWDTEYATYAWYTGEPSLDKNPNARREWAAAAEMRHGAEWRKIIEKVLNDE